MKTVILIAAMLVVSSCGTLTQAGKATASQQTKPSPGQPKRKVKTGAFVFGVVFLPSLVVDFATFEIYRK